MGPVGRFTIPPGYATEGAPILGQILPGALEASEVLKEGVVYEIIEFLGVLTLHEVGPSALKTQQGGEHFGWDYNGIMTQSHGAYALTEEEMREGRRRESET